MLADGLVLGAAGAVLGLALGVVASAGAFPWLSTFSDSEPGGFRVAPLELLGAGVVGVVTGLTAAWAPAIVTGRQDVLTALTGRRGATGTPWKLPALGLIGVAVGAALIFFGAFHRGMNTLSISSGIALAELGAVVCTPLLVSWSGRLASFLPLSGRLALRDSARNRGRTAPAVAAIMAALAGASAVAVILTSTDARDRAQYSSELRPGEAAVGIDGTGFTSKGVDPQTLANALGAALPTHAAAVEYAPGYGDDAVFPSIERPAVNLCPYYYPPNSGYGSKPPPPADTDPRCVDSTPTVMHHFTSTEVTIGGPDLRKCGSLLTPRADLSP